MIMYLQSKQRAVMVSRRRLSSTYQIGMLMCLFVLLFSHMTIVTSTAVVQSESESVSFDEDQNDNLVGTILWKRKIVIRTDNVH
jgi:hypothetical protein